MRENTAKPTVAVVVAVHNERVHLPGLLDALRAQDLAPDEVVLVDDGSTDETPRLLEEACGGTAGWRWMRQPNRGPAAARNTGWRTVTADICAFTDGDCVPRADWLRTLVAPFNDPGVGGVGGTYETVNTRSVLARFIGLEIAWRYRHAPSTVNVHGSYNLAVRTPVLRALGGFDEAFRKPSGEDWDLTWRLSRRWRLVYEPAAVVGHHHPERLLPYLRNQHMRARDRVRLYRSHPELRGADNYTGRVPQAQAACVVLLVAVLPLVPLGGPFLGGALLVAACALVLACVALPFMLPRDVPAALLGVPVQLVRSAAWVTGFMHGTWDGLRASPSGGEVRDVTG